MSQTSTTTDADRDEQQTTAEDVVDEHRVALERLAAEDTRVGAIARDTLAEAHADKAEATDD